MRDLLGFEERTAGALMTTDYIVVGEAATVEGAIAALKNYEGQIEAIHFVYLVGVGGKLRGTVPVSRLLLSEADTPLSSLTLDPLVSVEAQADENVVVDLFHKYNLMSLPVVDDYEHLLGVIAADDVLEVVINRK